MDARLQAIADHLTDAKDALLDASSHVDAVRELGLAIEGDYSDLVFAPVANVDDAHAPLGLWIERADRFVASVEQQARAEPPAPPKPEPESPAKAAAAQVPNTEG